MTELVRPTDGTPVRPEIVASWRRVREHGLATDAQVDPEDVDAVDPLSRLRRAAGPVLRELAATLEGSPYTLVLADHEARLVDIRFGQPHMRPALEEIGVVSGRLFSEAATGTNSIATAAETRAGISVHGGEHYLEAFRRFACYGLPITDPATRRAAGVLDITCREEDANSLLRPFLLRGVQDIEARLLGDTRRAHRRLLEAFDSASTSSGDALVGLGTDIVLTNDAAADLLQPPDHAVLQTLAGEIGRASGTTWRCGFTLESGRDVGLEAATVDGGVLLRITTSQRPAPIPRKVRGGTSSPEWVAWPSDDIQRHRCAGTSILVRGEPGTGRRTVARALTTGAVAELDGAAVRLGDVADLPADAETIMVVDADLLGDEVAALLESRSRGRRLVLTSAERPLQGRAAALAARCPVHLELPTLRSRRDRIPAVAAGLLRRTSGGRLRFTSGALQALAALDWPGNLGELATVVDHVARQRSVGDVTEADLPAGHRARRRAPATGALWQAEHDAVVAALRACSGNKVRAAEMLGVSRSTLYRHIRQFRIDPDAVRGEGARAHEPNGVNSHA